MSDSPSTAAAPTERGSARAFLYVLVAWWLVPAVLLVAGLVLLPDSNSSGQCEGIGFGCALTPRDGVEFLAFFAAIPLCFCGLLSILLLKVPRDRRPGFRAAWPVLQAAAAVGAVLAVAVVGVLLFLG